MSEQPCWESWSDEVCAGFIAGVSYEGAQSQLRQDVIDLLRSRRAPSRAFKELVEACRNHAYDGTSYELFEFNKILEAAEKELAP